MNNTSLYKSAAGEQAVIACYDAALQQWPVPFSIQRIPTRHGSTFIIVSGDDSAPPLVLLHGAGGNSTMWAGDVERFSRRFRVYAVDLVGEAGKSAPTRPPWDSPAFAEWLKDVLDGLHLRQVTLVGMSQGAWTALKFAVSEPQRIHRLVLIAPGGIVPDRFSFTFKAILWMMFGRQGARRLVQELFGAVPVPEAVMALVVQMVMAFKPRMGVLPIFDDAELQRLNMPILLVGGTKDSMRDVDKIGARLNRCVPHLTVKRIPGAGHAMLETASHLADFLAL